MHIYTCIYIYIYINEFLFVFLRNSLGIPKEPFGILDCHMFQESLQFDRIWYDSTSAMAAFDSHMQFRSEP